MIRQFHNVAHRHNYLRNHLFSLKLNTILIADPYRLYTGSISYKNLVMQRMKTIEILNYRQRLYQVDCFSVFCDNIGLKSMFLI